MENYKKFGRIAGFLFLSNTLITIISSIYGNIRIGASVLRISFAISSVPWVLTILFSIGLITDSIKMARVSAIIRLIPDTLSLIILCILILFTSYYSVSADAPLLIYSIAAVLVWLFILLGVFNYGKKARAFCLLAFVSEIAYLLASNLYAFCLVGGDISSWIDEVIHPTFTFRALIVSLILVILFCATFWFLGLYLQNRPSPGSHSHDDASAAETQG